MYSLNIFYRVSKSIEKDEEETRALLDLADMQNSSTSNIIKIYVLYKTEISR